MNIEGEGAENMERKTKTPYVQKDLAAPRGVYESAFEPFDVICVLGTVRPDPDGNESPTLAAFRLIAEHDAPGTYKFPNQYGQETIVEVLS